MFRNILMIEPVAQANSFSTSTTSDSPTNNVSAIEDIIRTLCVNVSPFDLVEFSDSKNLFEELVSGVCVKLVELFFTGRLFSKPCFGYLDISVFQTLC